MNATADRDTRERGTNQFSFPVKAGVLIHAGTLVAIEVASNLATPGRALAGLKIVGRAEKHVDNRNGIDKAASVPVRRGMFCWANGAGADQITLGMVGSTAWALDDQTVGATNGGGTRSVAGTIRDVDQTGVWVET